MEKTQTPTLPHPNQVAPTLPPKPSPKRRLTLALALVASLALVQLLPSSSFLPFHDKLMLHRGELKHHGLGDDACYQPPSLSPSHDILSSLEKTYGTQSFLERSAEWLGGAVRVETQIYDLYGSVEEDPVWEKFAKFHDCKCQRIEGGRRSGADELLSSVGVQTSQRRSLWCTKRQRSRP